MTSRKHIAIIDCAIKTLSINCFNYIVEEFGNVRFTYHPIVNMGLDSLSRVQADAYITLGSHSNICDRLEWQLELAQFIKTQLTEHNKPVLGICFAHQLIADLFGSSVEKISNDDPEFSYSGTRKITFLRDALGFNKGDSVDVFTSHSYEVKNIPEHFLLLATSQECYIDALIHEELPFVSFQSHPEASAFFVEHTINPKRAEKVTPEQFTLAQKGGHKIINAFISIIDSVNQYKSGNSLHNSLS